MALVKCGLAPEATVIALSPSATWISARPVALPADDAHAGAVDIVVGQEAAQGVAEGIVADRAHHRRRDAEPRRGDGLVQALAAGQERHLGAEQRLAGMRPPYALHDHIHVEAAADDDAAHTGRLMSSSADGQVLLAQERRD